MSEHKIVSVAPQGTDRSLTEALRDIADEHGLADGQWVLVFHNGGQSSARVLADIATQLGANVPDTDENEEA